jgi:hypothetical protein
VRDRPSDQKAVVALANKTLKIIGFILKEREVQVCE